MQARHEFQSLNRTAMRMRRRILGLTLIELMVALGIGSFLMIGAITVFMQSRTTFRINESVARMQENGRFVLDTIEPDIRMASFFGLTARPVKVQGRATPTDPIAFVPLAQDCGQNWSVNLIQPIEGWNNAYGWTCAAFGGNGWQPASDTFVIRRVTEDPVPAVPGPQANTLYVQSARFQDSQIFIGPALPPGYLPTTSATHQLVVAGYYVSQNSSLDTPGNPIPSLRRKSLNGLQVNDFEVLPGVEDMQVQFGVDTDVVGAPNRGAIDRWVNPRDPIIDPTNAAFMSNAEVLAIRVWLRIRAERPENGFVDTNVYNYADLNWGPPNDGFRRIVVSKTIYMRNARPPS
jgi:type IV pilus assembly protein PilW